MARRCGARTRAASWARRPRDYESYDQRRGRSRRRPIYRRTEERLFAVLAVGAEAEIDKAGYASAVRLAKQRLKRLEKAKEKE